MPRAYRRKAATLTLRHVRVAAPVAEASDQPQRLQAKRMRLVEHCFEALVDLYDRLFPAAEQTGRVPPEKVAALKAVTSTFRTRQERLQRRYEQATRDKPPKTVH